MKNFTIEEKDGELSHRADVWAERLAAVLDLDLPFETSFYEEEWNRVVIAQEALTLEKYIKATRNGRGTRLDRKRRMLVWKVLDFLIMQ